MILTRENMHSYCTACGDCLLWNLGCNNVGYPIARLDGKTANVRRYLWEQKAGRKLGKGQVVRSTCGNPRCVKHLASASRGELTALAYANGNRNAAKEYVQRVNAHMKRGKTVLDWDKAREIRARRDEGSEALATEFGVDKSTVKYLLAGKTWIERPHQSSVFEWRGTVAMNGERDAA
jgi:hypothetical protein